MYGELIPLGGGDSIPLLKKTLLVGRRESCDIRLRFANVSAHHCQLTVSEGYWFVKDMQSRNGIKVNNVRVPEKRLDPGDVLSVAKHRYEIQYSPYDLGAVGPPPADKTIEEEIMSKSLLERSGLVKKINEFRDTETRKRYDVLDDQPGQIKDPNRPM